MENVAKAANINMGTFETSNSSITRLKTTGKVSFNISKRNDAFKIIRKSDTLDSTQKLENSDISSIPTFHEHNEYNERDLGFFKFSPQTKIKTPTRRTVSDNTFDFSRLTEEASRRTVEHFALQSEMTKLECEKLRKENKRLLKLLPHRELKDGSSLTPTNSGKAKYRTRVKRVVTDENCNPLVKATSPQYPVVLNSQKNSDDSFEDDSAISMGQQINCLIQGIASEFEKRGQLDICGLERDFSSLCIHFKGLVLHKLKVFKMMMSKKNHEIGILHSLLERADIYEGQKSESLNISDQKDDIALRREYWKLQDIFTEKEAECHVLKDREKEVERILEKKREHDLEMEELNREIQIMNIIGDASPTLNDSIMPINRNVDLVNHIDLLIDGLDCWTIDNKFNFRIRKKYRLKLNGDLLSLVFNYDSFMKNKCINDLLSRINHFEITINDIKNLEYGTFSDRLVVTVHRKKSKLFLAFEKVSDAEIFVLGVSSIATRIKKDMYLTQVDFRIKKMYFDFKENYIHR